MLCRLTNSWSRLRRDVLVMIYCMYVRSILRLEVGCVLFSSGLFCKKRPLDLLVRDLLCFCIGLPKFVASDILYIKKHRLHSIFMQFHELSVYIFIKDYGYPQGGHNMFSWFGFFLTASVIKFTLASSSFCEHKLWPLTSSPPLGSLIGQLCSSR